MPGAELTTARLSLRPAGAGDLEALHGLWTDPGVRRYLMDGKVVPRTWSAETLAVSEQTFAARGFGIWAVRLREGDEIVGFCGLRPDASRPEVTLLYGLAPALWGRGLAFEAARTVLAHGFGDLGLERVAASVDTVNAASLRVLERLGMRLDGLASGAFGELRWYVLDAEDFRVATRTLP